jgi:putative cell wall-binding protein
MLFMRRYRLRPLLSTMLVAVLLCATAVFAPAVPASASPVVALAADDLFATAPAINPGTHNGTVSNTIDIFDRFAITLAEDQWVELKLTGPVGTDFDLRLYSVGVLDSEADAPGAYPMSVFLVAESKAEATSSEHVTHLVAPGGGGTYYVEVEAFGGSGAYTLTYTRTSPKAARLGGADRFATSYAISRSSFTTAPAVVVASGMEFADALSAAGLAGALDAPVLLAPPVKSIGDPMLRALIQEVSRLQASKVIVVGGSLAVNDLVYAQLGSAQFVTEVDRIGGQNRYQTSRMVAEETRKVAGGAVNTFLVRGDDFADALAVAPYAHNRGIPVLLTPSTVLHSEARSFIENFDVLNVIVAGGTSAVSPAVVTATSALNGGATTVVRRSGIDRYATAAAVATYCIDTKGWGSWSRLGIATGRNFPDALGGGAACGIRNGGALLLTDPNSLSSAASNLLQTKAPAGAKAVVFGGTGAVSATVMSQVTSRLP